MGFSTVNFRHFFLEETMRNWCATVVIGALLAVPLCAQQKDANTAAKSKEIAVASAPANDFRIAPASRNLFAMPAAAPMPADIFTDWANNAWNRHAWGRLTPRWEVAGLYQYLNFNPGSSFRSCNNHGATGSFTFNPNNWLGLTAEIGGYHFSRETFVQNGTTFTPTTLKGSLESYLFGPKVNIRHFDHFVPFFEFLVGAAHGGAQVTGDQGRSSFALAAGGGLDIPLWKNVAWRFFEADYLMTNFSGPLLDAGGRENNFRIGTGVVLRWGYPPAPRRRPPFTRVPPTRLPCT